MAGVRLRFRNFHVPDPLCSYGRGGPLSPPPGTGKKYQISRSSKIK